MQGYTDSVISSFSHRPTGAPVLVLVVVSNSYPSWPDYVRLAHTHLIMYIVEIGGLSETTEMMYNHIVKIIHTRIGPGCMIEILFRIRGGLFMGSLHQN